MSLATFMFIVEVNYFECVFICYHFIIKYIIYQDLYNNVNLIIFKIIE